MTQKLTILLTDNPVVILKILQQNLKWAKSIQNKSPKNGNDRTPSSSMPRRSNIAFYAYKGR